MVATGHSRTTSLLRNARTRSRTVVSPTSLSPGRYTASNGFSHQPPRLPEMTFKESVFLERLPSIEDDQTSESDLTSISSSNLDALEAEVEPELHAGHTAQDGSMTPSRFFSVLSAKVAANEGQLAESSLPLEKVTTAFDDRPVPATRGNQPDASPGPAISEVFSGSSLIPGAIASTTTSRSGQRPVRHVRFIGGEKPENPIIIEDGTSDNPPVL